MKVPQTTTYNDAVTETFTLVGVKAGETATIGLFETSLFADKARCLHRTLALFVRASRWFFDLAIRNPRLYNQIAPSSDVSGYFGSLSA